MADYVLNLTNELNRVHSQVVQSLADAAAFSTLSNQFSRLPEDSALPEPEVVMRFGAVEEVAGRVRKRYSALGTAFAVISMISGFEAYLTWLLLFRRFAERVAQRGALPGDEFNRLRTRIQGESRASPKRLVEKLVASPSDNLRAGGEWLDGIYRLRLCLTHRGGLVDARDVNQSGKLTVKWRKAELYVGDKPLDRLPFHVETGGQVRVRFVDENRSWSMGEPIELGPDDCQHMAFSLAFLAGWLREESHTEIQQLLGQGRVQP
jgi:hypothetical protein